MKKRSLLLFGIALLFAVALPLHGQDGGIGTSGCDDSPENATAILAVVGSVGAFLTAARARYKAGRGASK
jgi:XrtJ-associated TM-motif-TM protein